MAEPRLSAVVVAARREAALSQCIQSVLAQDMRDFELLVVLNGASSSVTALTRQLADGDPRLRVLTRRGGSASVARNFAVEHARGPVLYFLDDDVTIPVQAFTRALELLEHHPEVSIAGGPNLTPPDDPSFARMTGAVLASLWGTGITHARYARAEPGPASERDLILCNLLVRRTVFERGLSFPRPFGGEENVLMGNATSVGMGLWYSPELWAYHARRRTLAGYAEQVHRYGWGRAIAILSAPHTAHPLYFVPLVFTFYLVALLPLKAAVGSAALMPLGLYAVGTLVASLVAAAREGRLWFALPLLLLFPMTHVAYAFGLLQLFFRWPALRRRRARRRERALRGESPR